MNHIQPDMKLIFLILIITSLLSCSDNVNPAKKENETLSFLAVDDTLCLSFIDKKCGEWGGDTRNVFVYYKVDNGVNITVVDINESIINCDSIENYIGNPLEKSYEKKRIKIETQQTRLIKEAVDGIIQIQMNFDAKQGISNSGCMSGLRTTNEKFYILVYPSPKWKAFDKLFRCLKNIKR